MRPEALRGRMDDEEGVALDEGMPVTNEEGESLGTLAAVLIPEGEEEMDDEDDSERFLLVRADGVDRLVPFESVLGVGDGSLVLDVPAKNMGKFPALQAEADPTPAQMEQAYRVFDEGATDPDDLDD